jgi:hypothetical protein
VWWDINQARFLDLRSAIWRGPTTTGDDDYFLGEGTSEAGPLARRPTDAQLSERVLPALLRALEHEKQPEIVSGCLTALAKVASNARPEDAEAATETLLTFLGNASQQNRETAAVALGILGGPANLRTLASLLADDSAGQKLSRGSRVSERTRAFAAYGLGVLAQRTEREDLRRFAVQRLAHTLEEELDSHEIATACVNALGLIELESRPRDGEDEDETPLPPSASREALVAFVLDRFDDRDLDRRARGHVPRALARLAAPRSDPTYAPGARADVLSALLEPLAREQAFDREVVHGAIQALGTLAQAASPPEEKAARRLLDRAFTQGDVLGRGFALIALAQTATRPGAPPEALADIRPRLLEVLAKGKSRERPWAALALGVLGYRLRAGGEAVSGEVDQALRLGFVDTGAPIDAAAYAIALGLRGDLASASAIRERMESVNEDRARGELALALGLMRDRSSTERLRELLNESIYRPDLIRPVAIALALLDDEALVPALVGAMQETESSSMRSVYAWTLAHVGDARAVDPLIALLEDEDVPELTRGIAALGLGITCERTPLPWNTELARDANYPAAPSSYYDPNGGGVLNIR